MLMNFSPLGLMNKPTYQTLDEVEIAKQIESMEERENSHAAADPTEHDKKTVVSRLLSVFKFKNRPPQGGGCLRVVLSFRTF